MNARTENMESLDYAGRKIGNYLVDRLLGKGGMGAVYLGRHFILEKTVAVKVLHTDLVNDPDVLKRFFREAKAADKVNHPNIIRVFDVGVTSENEPYIVMEYLKGESLAGMLQKLGPINLSAACAILEPTLNALAAAHEQGIIHRDLKPENIFLAFQDDGPPIVKLIDFGISKLTDPHDDARLTKKGMIIGTPAYMPPEQIRSAESIDHRADLYAVGVILYEMLTGKLPFSGNDSRALLVSVLADAPASLKDTIPDIPDAVAQLAINLLSKDRNDRPQNATVLLEELRKLSCFTDRAKHLSVYTSDITAHQTAHGDLGSKIEQIAHEPSTQQLKQRSSDKQSSGGWSETLTRPPKKWRLISTTAAISTTLAIIGSILFSRFTAAPNSVEPSPASAAQTRDTAAKPTIDAPKKNESAPTTVQLTVSRIPEGATIYFARERVSSNPFSVKTSTKSYPLLVTADGFNDFNVPVTPNRDQTIEAALTPILKPAADTPIKPILNSTTPHEKKDVAPQQPTSGSKKKAKPVSTKKASQSPKDAAPGEALNIFEQFEE